MIASIFADSPEYIARRETPFAPPELKISEVHAAIPQHLFRKSIVKALYYVFRDVFFVALFFKTAIEFDSASLLFKNYFGLGKWSLRAISVGFWLCYWWWQGIAMAGFWCLGHEAGHGTLSSSKWVNDILGFSLHTFLLVPYYAWRTTHHAHHKATCSVERDENYVPRTRQDYGLPPKEVAVELDYHEIFEETPLYTLFRMLAMQLLGWQIYLCRNTLGSPMYPPGTNHFLPSSPLFKPHQRNEIIASNLGLTAMSLLLFVFAKQYGMTSFLKLYFVPYLLANHWIVMLTFLHHTDPTIPHYRNSQWSWVRGALATVDRPLLGPLGRFFLHNVSHDHIAHHLFSNIPFYNQPEVTEIVKGLLKEEYNYDSTNTFRALYRAFTQCCFIEDDGDIVFYKNRDGKAQRVVATVSSK
ncbi:delta-12 fatty acid desaturase [Abortiporus biennis]|nr:delta-12 fatty acid desaturase [Abortiporus biennis]